MKRLVNASDLKNRVEELRLRVCAARGEVAPDLLLMGGRVVDVFTGDIFDADVAVLGGHIVGVGSGYSGPRVLDCCGKFITPGFIDGHIHIESTLLSPRELAKALVHHGTTAVVCDPHEIANVLGAGGIEYILDEGAGLPLDVFVMLPSCVPATHLETAGAELPVEELLKFAGRERVLGLAEMMNYPGVLSGREDVLEKIAAFCELPKDGHAPLLSGKDLNAYVGAGLHSDHECTRESEAREKLRLGVHVMIREGTQAKNLRALLPVVTPRTVARCSLVTDDLHPHDILERGHLDFLMGMAVEEGLDPVLAVTMATLSPARYFGLEDRGAVAPGYRADIAVLSSLRPLRVETVVKDGRVVCHEGSLTVDVPSRGTLTGLSPMNIKSYTAGSFAIPGKAKLIRVIGLVRDQILTTLLTEEAAFRDGLAVADTARDIVKVAVVERHRRTGNIGLGFVRGFGLKKGALASSVAHDSHNIICVGCEDDDMFVAVKAVELMGGGLAAASDGKVTGRLPLPIAGLMSDRPLREVAGGWRRMRDAAERLGSTLEEPFMALSFLALPVIPELRLTDLGLVDVTAFAHVPLFVE